MGNSISSQQRFARKTKMKEQIQELLDDLRSWRFWYTLLMMVVGCAIFGIVVNEILVPQNYFAGGATG